MCVYVSGRDHEGSHAHVRKQPFFGALLCMCVYIYVCLLCVYYICVSAPVCVFISETIFTGLKSTVQQRGKRLAV